MKNNVVLIQQEVKETIDKFNRRIKKIIDGKVIESANHQTFLHEGQPYHSVCVVYAEEYEWSAN